MEASTLSLGLFITTSFLWLLYGWLIRRDNRLRGGGAGFRRNFFGGPHIMTTTLLQILLYCALQMGVVPNALRGGGFDQSKQMTLILALQWTGGACYKQKMGPRCDNCYRTFWTVHGLWGPENDCTVYEQFTTSNLDIRKMNQLWPSCVRSNEDFWTHEWEKHGTCFRYHQQLNSVEQYFSKALRLTEQANVYGALSSADITPNTNRPVRQAAFITAIQKAHGARPRLNCFDTKDGTAPKNVLTEIQLCFDKDFNARDCHGTSYRCRAEFFYEPVPRGQRKSG